jgi:hypothetical protein
LHPQNVLDLGGSNPESEGAECAVGRRVTVSAHDCGAGERETLLWPDYVGDALSLIAKTEALNAEVGRVSEKLVDLCTA